MTPLFGFTRNVVTDRYALLTPAGFVTAPLPGWREAACVVLISPAMGANFSQLLVTLTKRGEGAGHTDEDEWFAIVLEGACRAVLDRQTHKLVQGGYVFIPPKSRFEFSQAAEGTRLLIFQKRYVPLKNAPSPRAFAGKLSDQPGAPFLGDPDAQLQTLLPETPAFDMAINVFTFQPGATLRTCR